MYIEWFVYVYIFYDSYIFKIPLLSIIHLNAIL